LRLPWFHHGTLPCLRYEIRCCSSVTVASSENSFGKSLFNSSLTRRSGRDFSDPRQLMRRQMRYCCRLPLDCTFAPSDQTSIASMFRRTCNTSRSLYNLSAVKAKNTSLDALKGALCFLFLITCSVKKKERKTKKKRPEEEQDK
jgi:homogentisate 1,2-dioxygenase